MKKHVDGHAFLLCPIPACRTAPIISCPQAQQRAAIWDRLNQGCTAVKNNPARETERRDLDDVAEVNQNISFPSNIDRPQGRRHKKVTAILEYLFQFLKG